MTESPTTPPVEGPSVDRAAAIARAKALHGSRNSTRKTSTASRIMVTGIAASSGMLLVAAMAAAANAGSETAQPAPQVIERVVVIEIATNATTSNSPATTAAAAPGAAEVTVIREVRVLPAPPQDPAPAPAPTEGS